MRIESTSDLMDALGKIGSSPEEFDRFLQEHPQSQTFQDLSKFLTAYLAEHPDLTTKQIYIDSNLSRDYGNQIINGRRPHPNKYKLVPLCIAMRMNVKEVNRALRLANQGELDPRNRLDMALIICINEKIHSMIEVNELLISYGIEPIV